MDGTVAVGLAGAVGLLIGVAAASAFRISERERTAPPPATSVLPAGVADVLAVLRSSALVLDASDGVVRASPSTYAVGLVQAGRLTSDALLRAARLVRRDGQIREVELVLPRGPLSGRTVEVAARVAPLGSDLVLVLVEDRTEARRVDAVRRDFVANVSHELKTPVGALSLLAEALLDGSDDPEAVRRFAGRMQYETGRLSDLVQEIIDLSRLQQHDPLQHPDRVDVDTVVADALDRCRLAATARGIELVSGGTGGLAVLGDEAQLVKALRNLVDNAVNYSPEHTRVTVSVRRVDGGADGGPGGVPGAGIVELSVTDQGIGIAAGDRERIFERFYRVDPARSRATGGTGLGLSIVKHITANHGGEVTVWSIEGSGSTFTMRLPAGADGTGAADRPTDRAPARARDHSPRPVPDPAAREAAT